MNRNSRPIRRPRRAPFKANAKTKTAPLARSQGFVRTQPMMRASRDVLDIRHTEIVVPINGTTDFAATGILINPGLATVFPWGSQVASAYDFYVPKSVTVSFKPALPATESGMAFMFMDADVFDPAPPSMVVASGNAHCRTASIWAGMTQTYPASFFHTRRMFKMRTTNPPPDTTLDDYDCARLWVGTEGLAQDKFAGYVTMTYHFELHNPTVRSEGLSSLTLKYPEGHTAPAGQNVDKDLDLTGAVVKEIVGKIPINVEVGETLVKPGLELAQNFSGTVSASLVNYLSTLVEERSMGDQDELAFTHRFEGDTSTRSNMNVNRYVDASSSGFHKDLSSNDDFFIAARRGATIQPRLRDALGATYSGSPTAGLSEVKYLFNTAKNLTPFLEL